MAIATNIPVLLKTGTKMCSTLSEKTTKHFNCSGIVKCSILYLYSHIFLCTSLHPKDLLYSFYIGTVNCTFGYTDGPWQYNNMPPKFKVQKEAPKCTSPVMLLHSKSEALNYFLFSEIAQCLTCILFPLILDRTISSLKMSNYLIIFFRFRF